jgi:hypothetical protein
VDEQALEASIIQAHHGNGENTDEAPKKLDELKERMGKCDLKHVRHWLLLNQRKERQTRDIE